VLASILNELDYGIRRYQMEKTNLEFNETKKNIFYSSKRLFYEKGYYATSIGNISEAANVNRALLSYYFENKSNLAQEVVNQFSDRVFDKLKQETDQKYGSINPLVMLVVSTKVFTSFRRFNESYRRFIKEVALENIVMVRNTNQEPKTYGYLDSVYNMKFSSIDKQIYQNSFTSIVRGLMISHSDGYIDCSHEYIAEKQCEMYFKILGLEKSIIDDTLQEAKFIYDNINIKMEKNFSIK
jgi:AcrR family transcriptional regulator